MNKCEFADNEHIHILIVDDNKAVHETIGVYLEAENFRYSSAFDGKEAIELFCKLKPDFIILDIMLPKITGMEVCKEIRKKSEVPILMLTARDEKIDCIVGLEIGADDYVIKPFSPREIVARIKTILRRVKPKSTIEEKKIVRAGNLTVDLNSYIAKANETIIDATPKEIEILYLLASNAGNVISREQILSDIWGYEYFGDTRTVDAHINRLRKKLPLEGVNWNIKPIYGIGYKLEIIE